MKKNKIPRYYKKFMRECYEQFFDDLRIDQVRCTLIDIHQFWKKYKFTYNAKTNKIEARLPDRDYVVIFEPWGQLKHIIFEGEFKWDPLKE